MNLSELPELPKVTPTIGQTVQIVDTTETGEKIIATGTVLDAYYEKTETYIVKIRLEQ